MPTARQQRSNANRTFGSALTVLFAGAAFLFAMIGLVAVASMNGSNQGTSVAAAAPVHVVLSEFKIDPATVTVPVGGKLHVQNGGTMVHNLEVREGSEAKVKSPDVKPGSSAEVDV